MIKAFLPRLPSDMWFMRRVRKLGYPNRVCNARKGTGKGPRDGRSVRVGMLVADCLCAQQGAKGAAAQAGRLHMQVHGRACPNSQGYARKVEGLSLCCCASAERGQSMQEHNDTNDKHEKRSEGRAERGGSRRERGEGRRPRHRRRKGGDRRERAPKLPPLEENVPIPEAFQKLGLSETMLKAVYDLGYSDPTPVQEQAIPEVLAGRDLLAAAQTGTGKTAAFLLPAMDGLAPVPAGGGPRMLVVTPTRELAQQIDDACRTIARRTKHHTLTVVGGLSYNPQKAALKRGVDVLVATPGRLVDLINQGAAHLDQVEVLVLDEADRMLDMGFLPDMRKIVERVPAERQTLLFSATLDEKAIGSITDLVSDPARVEIVPEHTAAETVDQYVLPVATDAKNGVLTAVLKREGASHVIVFCRTKRRADTCCRRLERAGISCAPIHGDRSQAARMHSLRDFRDGKVDVIVATDVLARGIDVSDVRYVINFDVPVESVDYIHRIGRTGRAGEKGWALTIVTGQDVGEFYQIEGLMGQTAELFDAEGLECGRGPEIDPNRKPGARAAGTKRGRSGRKRDKVKSASAGKHGRADASDRGESTGQRSERSRKRSEQRRASHDRARAVAEAWDAMAGEKRGVALENGEIISAHGDAGEQRPAEEQRPLNRKERRERAFGKAGEKRAGAGKRRPGDHGRAGSVSFGRGWEESDRDDTDNERGFRGRRAGIAGRGSRGAHRDGYREERGSRSRRDEHRARFDADEREDRRDHDAREERGARKDRRRSDRSFRDGRDGHRNRDDRGRRDDRSKQGDRQRRDDRKHRDDRGGHGRTFEPDRMAEHDEVRERSERRSAPRRSKGSRGHSRLNGGKGSHAARRGEGRNAGDRYSRSSRDARGTSARGGRSFSGRGGRADRSRRRDR